MSDTTVDRDRAERLARAVADGANLRDAGASEGVSGERARQVIAAHPDLAALVETARRARFDRAREQRSEAEAGRRQGVRRREGRESYTDDQILDAVRRFAANVYPATAASYRAWVRENGGPSLQTVSRLGRLDELIALARGVAAPEPVGRRGPSVTVEECRAALIRVARLLEAWPTLTQYEDMRVAGDPSAGTVRTRLGDGLWSACRERIADEMGWPRG